MIKTDLGAVRPDSNRPQIVRSRQAFFVSKLKHPFGYINVAAASLNGFALAALINSSPFSPPPASVSSSHIFILQPARHIHEGLSTQHIGASDVWEIRIEGG